MEAGITIEAKLVPLKARSPILVRLDPASKVRVDSISRFRKAPSAMVVTFAGISTDTGSELEHLNVVSMCAGMLVTFSFLDFKALET